MSKKNSPEVIQMPESKNEPVKPQEMTLADHQCVLILEEGTVMGHTICMCVKDVEVRQAIVRQLERVVQVTQAQIMREAAADGNAPLITLASKIPGLH